MPYLIAVVIFETIFFVVQWTKREKKHDAEVERLRGQVDELATLWEAATDAVNLDTDASLGEWQTAFDGLVATYHASGYRAGGQDSLTENTALRAQINAAKKLHPMHVHSFLDCFITYDVEFLIDEGLKED